MDFLTPSLNAILKIAYVVLIALVSAHALRVDIKHEEIRRPDLMAAYLQARKKCVWKVTEKQPWDQCRGDRMECRIPFSIPQGSGYIVIVRYGPYSSTGDFMETLCTATGHVPPIGSWLILGVVGAVDPYSEEFFEFPPIHVHHIVPKTRSFSPRIPPAIAQQYPWLDFWHYTDKTFLFPSSAADSQCLTEFGGINCLLCAYPSGYGKKAYHADKNPQFIFHVQDVRDKDSPKMSYMVEFAQGFITDLNPQIAPLKPVFDVTLGIFGSVPPYTYDLKYDTPMYNFVTYYFPMKAVLAGISIHWHAVNGDEAWIVRGTQSDLGIPQSLQRPPALGTYEPPAGAAVEAKQGLKALKKEMKQNLLNSQEQFLQLHNGRDRLKRSEIDSSLFSNNDGFEYLHWRNSTLTSISAPQMLCAFYGVNEHVTKTVLEEKATASLARVRQPYRGVQGVSAAIANAISTRKPAHELVDFDNQIRAVYDGTLPGHYYRSAVSGMSQEDSDHKYCYSIDVAPGEFLTFIHFIEPRPESVEQGLFNSNPLTIHMHSALVMHVHIPDFPYL